MTNIITSTIFSTDYNCIGWHIDYARDGNPVLVFFDSCFGTDAKRECLLLSVSYGEQASNRRFHPPCLHLCCKDVVVLCGRDVVVHIAGSTATGHQTEQESDSITPVFMMLI